MLKSLKGASWFVCFKSEHLEKVKGTAVIYVGATRYVVNINSNKKKRVEVPQRRCHE